ncbi:MAG TPA: hypothetical protein VGR12_06390 [Solirubrobacteraceae bacterium]|nr:hypothetical protein [Solirubrobacteraceae bacterium]
MKLTRRRLARVGLFAVLASLAGCGSDDPPTTDAVRSCVRDLGARLETPSSGERASWLHPPQARLLGTVQWTEAGRAILYAAGDDGAARQAQRSLTEMVANFGVPSEHVRRAGRFVVLLGPADVPAEDQRDQLLDCLD